MNRRECIQQLAATAVLGALPRRSLAEEDTLRASLEIDVQSTGATLPPNFTGLSYESAQLGNPYFFSGSNTQLIRLFRSLGEHGVLRLGGGTSEFTRWSTREMHGPPPFDSFGPDTSMRKKSTITITPGAIRNLRTFLDATGWQLLYGLKAARGTPQEAAVEAKYVQQMIGPKLLAFQIGNEPDAWRNRYRPPSWRFDDYYVLWKRFHAAIVREAPEAHFAGPDVSSHMDWVVQFAELARDEIILLTGHYYAEGPATSPTATLNRLLSPDPMLKKDLDEVMSASSSTHIPYRMSEGNSCWDGGKPGVSDTLGSALWVADMMLEFARAGCVGVNLHGGGNGYYTPIAGGLEHGFTQRPEFYGMQFAGLFVNSTLLKSILTSPSDRLKVYAANRGRELQLALVNKGTQGIAVSVDGAALREPLGMQRACVLTGPSLESKHDVTLRQMDRPVSNQNRVLVPAHSAVLSDNR